MEPKTLIHSQHRRKISPIIEDKVETFNRMSAFGPSRPYTNDYGAVAGMGMGGVGASSVVPDTGEQAIKRITEMGFTRAEAQRALRETDRGDGLRVDWAVEMLLRGMS